MNLNLKEKRENFIRGHNGSTVEEVIVLTAITQLSNLLLISVLSLFPSLTQPKLKAIRFLTEFLILFFPFVLSVTLLSEYINQIFITVVLLIIITIKLCFITKETKSFKLKQLLEINLINGNRLTMASNMMSSLLICVCVAILGVDFNAFPRRFAKTETYGWSLMDVGVGAFIAINAGLSPESRLATHSEYKPLFLLKKTLLATVPLLVLGFQRLFAVKYLEYQEHITEYGIHWNFFFTLAFTKIFSTIFCCLFSNKVNIGLSAFVILVIHQIGLSSGLSEFIQNDNRNGLLAANKEGIISTAGYLSLYLFFVEFGKFVFIKRQYLNDWLQIIIKLLLSSVVFGFVMILSHVYIEEVSRREANLAFVIWMIGFLFVLISLEYLILSVIEIFQYINAFPKDPSFRSIIYSSISYSGMLLFLVSNLFTGFINFSIDTIAVSDTIALLIILFYCFALSLFSVFCMSKKIQLKIPIKQKTT